MTMLLPKFELHQPTTVAEAVALAKQFGDDVDYISGGTDLLPNYKCGLNARTNVISLQHIAELKQISATEIGAGVTLTEIEHNTDVPAGVREAAAHIASPLLRESGTLGGNLMLDNRCHFFNQSYFWRNSLGYCLKADGDRCRGAEDQRGRQKRAERQGLRRDALKRPRAHADRAGRGGDVCRPRRRTHDQAE